MKEIVLNTETMTSLQIAEVTGKRHDAILRDIRNLLGQGVDAHNFVESIYKDANQRDRPCYELTKKGSLILASGYNAKLREKIINRWEELEQRGRPKPMTQTEILLQSVQALVEQERKMNQLEAKVEEIDTRTRTRPDYFTVVGYATLNGISVNLSTASRYGAKAARKCKELGVPTDTIPDPRFGQVKMYPKQVLDEIFNEAI